MVTSAQAVTVEILENLRTKIAILCSDKKLKDGPEEIRPFSWHKFFHTASKDPFMSLDQANRLWMKEKSEVGEAQNISPDDTKCLAKFQSITKTMIDFELSEATTLAEECLMEGNVGRGPQI